MAQQARLLFEDSRPIAAALGNCNPDVGLTIKVPERTMALPHSLSQLQTCKKYLLLAQLAL